MSKRRSAVKGFMWETIMLGVCVFIIWLWTGSILASLGINLLIYVIKVIGLSFYDWVWENKIKWQ